MVARLFLWWQQIKKYRATILVVAIILVVVIELIIVGYKFDWTGFNGNSKSGKTLWDWLQLLIITFALAIIAIFFNRAERKNEQRVASDNQQEVALQDYIKEISELLLHGKLRDSQQGDEVQTIARVRTLTVLPRLNGKRKGSVIQFLQEAGLIDSDNPIVGLQRADLSDVNLQVALLQKANLEEANLERADLRVANLEDANLQNTFLKKAQLQCAFLIGTNLEEAILQKADLTSANLTGAILRKADLEDANLLDTTMTETDLRYAIVTNGQLDKVHTLEDVIMPDGSIRNQPVKNSTGTMI